MGNSELENVVDRGLDVQVSDDGLGRRFLDPLVSPSFQVLWDQASYLR